MLLFAHDVAGAAYDIMFPALEDHYIWTWILARSPFPSG